MLAKAFILNLKPYFRPIGAPNLEQSIIQADVP